MRRILKRTGEQTLLRAGVAAFSARRHRGRQLVLAYHNIVPDGESAVGDRSLHLPAPEFRAQLDLLLEENVRVIPLNRLLDEGPQPASKGSLRQVAITFDDAYCGAVLAGAEELARRSLGATIFVVPGLLGGRSFWWDALADSTGALPPAVREAALGDGRGRDEEVRAWARRAGVSVGAVPEHARTATEAELRTAAAMEGIDVGSHTWSHPNLARLTAEECREELEGALHWLRERFDGVSPCLSYPYGLFSPETESVAQAVGHQGAFRIDGGWLPRSVPEGERYRLPRLNVPAGLSLDGFRLRLAGLLCG